MKLHSLLTWVSNNGCIVILIIHFIYQKIKAVFTNEFYKQIAVGSGLRASPYLAFCIATLRLSHTSTQALAT
ncbi:MAG: hypothetical protein R2822_20510 [Spirosomataceae bacterium]